MDITTISSPEVALYTFIVYYALSKIRAIIKGDKTHEDLLDGGMAEIKVKLDRIERIVNDLVLLHNDSDSKFSTVHVNDKLDALAIEIEKIKGRIK